MKCEDFSGEKLFESVDHVFNELEAAKRSPGAERWTTNTFHRNLIWTSVRDHYCSITGCKPYNFPFSMDGVVVAWLRLRKNSTKTERRREREKQQGELVV